MNTSSLAQAPLKAALLAVCVFASAAMSQQHQPGRFAGMPAPTLPALMPRAYAPPAAASPALIKRADESCGEDKHPCNDLQIEGLQACCENTQYCFLDSNWRPKCCALGSSCGEDCGPNSLLCNTTVTTTLSDSGSLTTTTLETASVATESGVGCCPRPCSESTQFLCPASLGGGCCKFGQVCMTSSCFWTATSLTTTSGSSLTIVPDGCSATTQFSCPASLSGGCCNNGETCTVVNGSPLCASNNSTSSGLSSGAKAGIGAGAAIGAGAVVALSTWAFLAWRRRRKERALEGREIGSRADGSGYDDDDTGTQRHTARGSRRPRRNRGQTASDVYSNSTAPYQPPGNEYSGPDAVPGPFTTSDASPTHPNGLGPGFAVPAGIPHGPGDIAAPVEIDGRIKQEEEEQVDRHPITQARVLSVEQSGPIEIYTEDPYVGAVEMVNFQAGQASTSPHPSPNIDTSPIQHPVSPASPQPSAAEPNSSGDASKQQ